MTPFSIQCTTCRRSLRVVDPQAIGQILSCPKCGSMVLVEPPPGAGPAGYSAAVANESASSSAVKMSAATVTESPQPLSGSAGSSVEMVREDSPSAVRSAAGAKSSSTVSTLITAAVIEQAAATGPGAPVVALAIAERIEETPPAAANTWPRWFLPSLLLALAAGFLIFAVRMMAPASKTDGEAPPAVAANVPPEKTEVEAPKPEQNKPDIAKSEDRVAPSKTKAEEKAPATEPTKETASPDNVAPPPQTHVAEQKPESKQTESQQPSRTDRMNFQSSAKVDTSAAKTAAMNAAAPPIEPQPQNAPPMPDQPTAPPGALHTRALQRVMPRQVDVDARLMDSIAGINVRGIPLCAYLDLVSEMSSVPITVDAEAVVDLGLSPATPVNVKLEQSTLAGALEAALEPLHLGYQVRDGQLIVGYSPQENMRQVRYAVGDLAEGDQELAEMAALVRRMVSPDSWQQSGGKATVVPGGETLVIEQTDPAHLAVLIFCEKLRVARDKAIKSRFDPARFILTTRTDKAHEILSKPISANFGQPQPLSGVVNWLRNNAGVALLVDHAALASQGMTDESECTVVADGKPLAAVLDEIVAPLDLAWRAIDDKTIEITTSQAASEQMDVEFYPVRDLVTDAPAGHSLVQRISQTIEPKVWGADPTQGAIKYDISGRTLIIRAPQRVQTQVETFLASQRKRK